MSAGDRFDRQLAAWMSEVASEPPPRGTFEAITATTARRRPRPAWLAVIGSDWLGTTARRPGWASPALRRGVAFALVAALLIATAIGVAGLVGGTPSTPERLPGLAYELDGDIYVADRDGTHPVRVVDTDPDAPCGGFWGLAVSPDGHHVALRSGASEGCPQTITIIDTDGHVVSSFPGEGWDISWSPDSTRVVTWLAISAEGPVGIYGIDGVLQEVLDGSNACCGDHDPVWSPDGAESVLIRHHDSSESQVVFELPLDGGVPHPVPADDPRSHLYSPVSKGPVIYSPDRTHAAYFAPSLVVVAADGTDRKVLVAGARGDVAGWSPDGTRIAFVDGAGAFLRVADVATGTVTTVATGTGIASTGFSPDGGHLLYRSTDTGGDALWAANADGSGTRVLVEGANSGAWLAPRSDAAMSPAP